MPYNLKSECLLAYAITDRHNLSAGNLAGFFARAVRAKVDLIQIREKDLTDNELYQLTCSAVDTAKNSTTIIIVNDRLDVALAAKANGVHLGNQSVPVEIVKKKSPQEFIIGVSTHCLEEATVAKNGNADYITFGPVFFTPSKAKYGSPVGVDKLKQVCAIIELPVFPVGGISVENFSQITKYSIAGVAAISMFQNAENLEKTVGRLKSLRYPG